MLPQPGKNKHGYHTKTTTQVEHWRFVGGPRAPPRSQQPQTSKKSKTSHHSNGPQGFQCSHQSPGGIVVVCCCFCQNKRLELLWQNRLKVKAIHRRRAGLVPSDPTLDHQICAVWFSEFNGSKTTKIVVQDSIIQYPSALHRHPTPDKMSFCSQGFENLQEGKCHV